MTHLKPNRPFRDFLPSFTWLIIVVMSMLAPHVRSDDVVTEVVDHGSVLDADYDQVTALLRTAIGHEVTAKNLPAFSIALVESGRLVWAEGFGFRDADQKQPASAKTVYRVGSVSKLFTDMAVMQLVQQGKLDLDAPVTRYLPSFAPTNPYEVPITLGQLMTHRSGLVRESPVGNYFDPDQPSLAATVAS